jgi:hypothetical protein
MLNRYVVYFVIIILRIFNQIMACATWTIAWTVCGWSFDILSDIFQILIDVYKSEFSIF